MQISEETVKKIVQKQVEKGWKRLVKVFDIVNKNDIVKSWVGKKWIFTRFLLPCFNRFSRRKLDNYSPLTYSFALFYTDNY